MELLYQELEMELYNPHKDFPHLWHPQQEIALRNHHHSSHSLFYQGLQQEINQKEDYQLFLDFQRIHQLSQSCPDHPQEMILSNLRNFPFKSQEVEEIFLQFLQSHQSQKQLSQLCLQLDNSRK
jgi:hypothetical protein